MKYITIFWEGYEGYARYLWQEITFSSESPFWKNYFFMLIVVSALFFALEWLRPWTKEQPVFRPDFWLDFFYMFFNFFLFSLLIYNAGSEVVVHFFEDILHSLGFENVIAIELGSWPVWAQWLTLFIVRDFIQWWVHRLLHYVPFLWEFHKVHHSVEQMGFASHLRYHWVETVVYRTLEYLPLAMIGFSISDFFVVHIFSLLVGHWNHANFRINIGVLGYVFNHPNMHRWHHAYHLPSSRQKGVNFGLSLSLWDYLFGTAYLPKNAQHLKLGFPGVESFPKNFYGQISHGLTPKKTHKPQSNTSDFN